jgi:hypothetical protein
LNPKWILKVAGKRIKPAQYDEELSPAVRQIAGNGRRNRTVRTPGGPAHCDGNFKRGQCLLQFNEPWKTVKEAPEMVNGDEPGAAIRGGTVGGDPAFPAVLRQIGCAKCSTWANPLQDKGDLLEILNELVEGNPSYPGPTTRSDEPEHLFSRIPDEVIEKQIAKLAANRTNKINPTAESPSKATSYQP